MGDYVKNLNTEEINELYCEISEKLHSCSSNTYLELFKHEEIINPYNPLNKIRTFVSTFIHYRPRIKNLKNKFRNEKLN